MNTEEKTKYITNLASVSGVSLEALKDQINLEPIFALETKPEINKLFFSTVTKFKETTPKIPQNLAKADSPTVQATLSKNVEKMMKANEAKILRRQEKVKNLVREIAKIQKEIVTFSKLNNSLVNKEKINFLQQFEKINKAGFWFVKAYNAKTNTVIIESVNDIICKDVDDNHLQVNLGKFIASINLKDLDLRIFSVKDCPTQKQLLNFSSISNEDWDEDEFRPEPHPYVCGDGFVCWGNASDTVTKLRKEFNVEKMLILLSALLTTHSGAGYTRLASYIKE